MAVWTFLSEWGQRAWAWIVTGVKRGLSGKAVLETLREFGIGYRTQRFYRDYSYAKYVWEKSQRIKYVRRDALIPEHMYFDAMSHTDYQYITVCRVKVFDMINQEEREIYVSVGHNELLRRGDIENIAKATVEKSPYRVLHVMPEMGYFNVTKVMR